MYIREHFSFAVGVKAKVIEIADDGDYCFIGKPNTYRVRLNAFYRVLIYVLSVL